MICRSNRLCMDTLENRCVPAGGWQGAWHLSGDHGADPADVVVFQLNPDDASQVQAVINGDLVGTRQVDDLRKITVHLGMGDDQVTTDLGDLRLRLRVFGGKGNDSLLGGRGSDLLIGGPGDDTVDGRGGIDVVFGGHGADDIKGGGNDDHLEGGRGTDVLQGGEGQDHMDGGQGLDQIFRQHTGDRVVHERGDLIVRDRTHPGSTLNQEQVTQFKEWLIETALDQWADLLGQPVPNHWYWNCDGGWFLDATIGVGDAPPVNGIPVNGGIGAGGTAGAADNFSGTNTQVNGVDEADFVKTDGDYIYMIHNNELWIIDTTPAEGTLAVTARVPIHGNAEGLYVFENHVTVLSSIWSWRDPMPGPIPIVGDPANGISIGIADGVPIWSGRSTQEVRMTVIDVSDHAAPTILEETTYDGYLVSSRALDDRVYLVMQNDIRAPMPEAVQDENGDYFYEAIDTYRQRLIGWATEEHLPGYSSIIVGAGDATEDGSLFDTPNLYLPDNASGEQVLSVILADVDDNDLGPTATTTVAGIWGGQVYASTENLYIISQGWDNNNDEPTSDIHKFELGIEVMPYVASGSVEGHVLNSFSMDEYNGFFRIATTNGWGGEASNNIFVLEQVEESLEVVGAVTNLAVGETIFAVRFLGNRGFVVTFQQIDPLFTLDLTNPTNPKVLGELEMPGFSTYLHPFGADRLIGFGREVDVNLRGSLQLSLFDVSDLTDPTRLDHYVFDDDIGDDNGWMYSDAEWNHHAFSFFEEAGVLAVPVQESYWSDANGYHAEATLAVFQVDAATGFTLLGEIEHQGAALRSFQIGELLFSIGTDALRVTALTDPSQHVATLTLPPVPDPIYTL